MDVSPEKAASRIIHGRDKKEMFEELDALRKVRAKALSLAQSDKWIIIDSNKPAIVVAAKIMEVIG